MIEKLVKNRRYFVYQKKINYNGGVIIFRATYLNFIKNTIFLKKDLGGNHSIPLSWIIKCLTLDEITNKQIALPIEIVSEIDSYL